MDDDGGSYVPPNPPMFGNIEFDHDLINQLLGDGCWLQTADRSSLLLSGPSTTHGSTFASVRFPGWEGMPDSLTSGPQQGSSSKERERWNLLANDHSSQASAKDRSDEDSQCQDQKSMILAPKSLNHAQSFSWEDDELKRLVWIEPRAMLGPSTTVKDRLISAISHLRELNRSRDVLIQIWVPVKKGLKSFLTTVEQPYFLQPSSTRLLKFRDVSEKYDFLADEDSKQALGLPGRVFLGKAPEWTPDVRFFRQEEYPRIQFAHQYDVRGSIALPVFEKGSGDCLGVVEVIMTTEKIDYRPEVESVCKALETVHLTSSATLNTSQKQAGIGSYESVRPEIIQVLRTVSDMHDLPLAQTWASCFQQGKGGCWHSGKNALCVSTVDSACYVRDQKVLEFHKACSEHHLLRGRGGIVGKAFETSEPCFATDVTEFSKADYPLSHHAKMFGLRGAVAIRLRSIYHELHDYVLEFYLPTDIQETGLGFHDRIGQSVSMVIQRTCRGLSFITVKDYEHRNLFAGKEATKVETKLDVSDAPKNHQETSSWFSHMMDPQRKGKEVALSLDFGENEPSREFKVRGWGNSEPEPELGQILSDCGNVKSEGISGLSSGGRFPLSSRKAVEKKRTKSQKTISLQVLRQYFAGSLKDAAKSIGVCPTTLKRICRQHGITRWPSRKIKKVGHSLRKLQLVIDSVQGAKGAIQLSSFYTNFPELHSPNAQSMENQAPSVNLNDQSKQQPTTQPEGVIFSSGVTTSNSASTSSSHTSTSSHCYISGTKLTSPVTTNASGSKDTPPLEDLGLSLKRARSEAELHILYKKEQREIIERCHSTKTLTEHHALPIAKSWPSRDAGVFKGKATFGEEKIRLSISANMGFLGLQQEIGKRFNLVELSKVGIKYLDDDKEWVLLTCDADLEECIDIHRSSGNRTIKLALSQLSHMGGPSGSHRLS